MTETTTAGARAREYETIYIMRPAVAKEAAEKIAGRVEEVVGREGGKLTQVETWGRRALAYPVAKQRRGVYVYVKYMGGGALVSELERNLRMLDDVIKYQTVQTGGDTELAGVSVDPEAVKFEAIEAPGDDEQEYSLERELGLVDSPDAPSLRDDSYDEEAEALAAVGGDDEEDK
ncbi:MAG: 30S ribosomal protein S6 [Myxococcales bacterium]|nr:30S ribosomal protein S6 [Myxococcales bacterium]